MPTAKKLPSGSYRVRVYDFTDQDGKKHYKSFTAPTKKEAEKLALYYDADNKKSSLTFHTLLENYLQSKEAVLSPATIRGYRNIQKQIAKNYSYLDMKTDIDKKLIQKFVNDMARTHSPKTVRNYYGLVTAVLEREFDVKLPQKVEMDRNIPTIEEMRLILDLTKDSELYVPVLLGSQCMMRRGEIAALTMDDIKDNVIHVNKDMVMNDKKEWIVKPPKTTSSDRYVVAPDFVIDAIKEKGYITRYNPHVITLMWDRFIRKNKLPHFRFHDLRHFGASYMHSKGIGDAYIQKQGGWKTDVVLKSVYRHVLSDEEQRIAELINQSKMNDFL